MTENNAENNSHGSTEPDHFVRFTNDHMFCSVMSDDQICIDFLNTILDLNITGIKRHENQKYISPFLDTHGVRLDVYVEDEKDVVYDIEMQVVNHHDLMTRSRYYQSLVDQDVLEKTGDYQNLKKTFIIFICVFDPFEDDLIMYRIKPTYELPDGERRICDDGTQRIFIYAGGHQGDVSEDFKNLMAYIRKSTVQGDLAERINKSVEHYNGSKEWRHAHMTLEQKMREKYNEGKAEGIAEGKAEGIAIGEAKGIVEIMWLRVSKDLNEIAKTANITVDQAKDILRNLGYIE